MAKRRYPFRPINPVIFGRALWRVKTHGKAFRREMVRWHFLCSAALLRRDTRLAATRRLDLMQIAGIDLTAREIELAAIVRLVAKRRGVL